MTNESGEIYTVQSFDEVHPDNGWTVDHETTDPLEAVLAARRTAYIGYDVRIIREGKMVWGWILDCGTRDLLAAPEHIQDKFPEWLVLAHDYDMPEGETVVMRMPTMSGETWGAGFSQEVMDEGHHVENMWKS